MKAGTFTDYGNGFWNLRGSFKIRGIVEVGTQASLIALPSGRFIWLDCYPLEGAALQKVMALTDDGKAVEAVLNLHPFHTLHCEWSRQAFPDAKFYGSARHKRRFPHLNWEAPNVEDPQVASIYGNELLFSRPRGVDYISADENVHFSSLLAYHKPSATLHVDDTLSYMKLPFPVSLVKDETPLFFHPTLAKALERRAGATADFQQWAEDIGAQWAGARRIVTAHNGVLDLPARDLAIRIAHALTKVEPVLAKQRSMFG